MPVHIVHDPSPTMRQSRTEEIAKAQGINYDSRKWIFSPHLFFYNSEIISGGPNTTCFAYTSKLFLERVLTDVFDSIEKNKKSMLILFDVCGYDIDTIRNVCMRSLLHLANSHEYGDWINVIFTVPYESMLSLRY